MDPLSLSRHYRCYPGQGDYPIVDYLDAARAPATRARCRSRSSTTSSGAHRRRRSRSTACARCARVRRSAGGAPRGARRTAARSICRRCRRRRLKSSGAEFIEFAVNDADAKALVALIEGLGFRLAGRHRSKDVDLFAQGEINLVVNREREGFAHSFALLHGPSVCALALRVNSIEKALERAAAPRMPELCRQDRAGRRRCCLPSPGSKAA